MNVIKFKTSLKCGGCVNAIRTPMNQIKEIKSWDVDLTSPDKILEVQTELSNTEELNEAILEAFKFSGYIAKKV